METLPPRLRGPRRGVLQLSFAPFGIATESASGSAASSKNSSRDDGCSLSVRFSWWGSDMPNILPLTSDPASPTSFQTCLCASRDVLDRYMSDSPELHISLVKDTNPSKALWSGSLALYDVWSCARDGTPQWKKVEMIEQTEGGGDGAGVRKGILPCCMVATFSEGTEKDDIDAKEDTMAQNDKDTDVGGQAEGCNRQIPLKLGEGNSEKSGRPEMGTVDGLGNAGTKSIEKERNDDGGDVFDSIKDESSDIVFEHQSSSSSTHQEQDKKDSPYKLEVNIESAFHLPSDDKDSGHRSRSNKGADGGSYVAFASIMMQRYREGRQYTHPATVVNVPGVGGRTAVWRSHLSLSVHDLDAFVTKESFAHHIADALVTLDNKYDCQLCESDSSVQHGPLLVVNVWRYGGGVEDKNSIGRLASLSLEERRRAAVKWTPFDTLIGSAAIDIRRYLCREIVSKASPRSGSNEQGTDILENHRNPRRDRKTDQISDYNMLLEGLFPLVDAKYQVKGTIKLSAKPNDALRDVLMQLRNGTCKKAADPENDANSYSIKITDDLAHFGSDNTAKSRKEPEISINSSHSDNEKRENQIAISEGNAVDPPKNVCRVATDGMASMKLPAFNNIAKNKYGTNEGESGKKSPVKYAWSGSDSDEDCLGAVGICFEGAVSCSDEELLQTGDTQGNVEKTSNALIAEDWMFDIGKTEYSNQDEIQFDTKTGLDKTYSSNTKENRDIVFKNRLPKAYADTTAVTNKVILDNSNIRDNNEAKTLSVSRGEDAILKNYPVDFDQDKRPENAMESVELKNEDGILDPDWRFVLHNPQDRKHQNIMEPGVSGSCLRQYSPMVQHDKQSGITAANHHTDNMDPKRSDEDTLSVEDQDRSPNSDKDTPSTREDNNKSKTSRGKRLFPTITQILRNRA